MKPYPSKEHPEVADIATRKHCIQVLRELIAMPETSDADREMYQRFLVARDPLAPPLVMREITPSEHLKVVDFQKCNPYQN